MQEERNSNRDVTDVPDSDATSEETLDDLENREQIPDLKNPAADHAPSPDGALDEPDETKDARPM